MAATERPDGSDTHRDLEGKLANASFVELRVAPSVDALAGAGILTTALAWKGVPFHARIHRGNDDPIGEAPVYLGTHSQSETHPHVRPGAVTASSAQIADTWGADDGMGLRACATVFQRDGGRHETTDGLGIPLEDAIEGLAHSTLVHGPFSGDIETTATLLDRVHDDPVALASLVALETLNEAAPRAATAIERLLAPVPTSDGPFATAAGTADVLDVLGEVDPGLGLALVCGHGAARDAAARTWKRIALDIHEHAETISPGEDAAIATVDTDIPAPAALARVIRDFRTTAAVTLVSGTDSIGIASSEISTMELANALGERCDDIVPRGVGRVSATPPDELGDVVSIIREVHA